MAERFTNRDRALIEIANDQADRYNDARHNALMASMAAMEDDTRKYRALIRESSAPGERREAAERAAAEHILARGNYLGRPAAPYQAVPQRLPQASPSEVKATFDPTGYWADAGLSLVEGALAGLSAPTADSQGFMHEFQKGASILSDPQAGVDKATLERLYGGDPGLRGMFISGMTDPELHAFGGLLPFSGGRPTRNMAIGTQLIDRHGNVIRQLRNAQPAPRLGLPAPSY